MQALIAEADWKPKPEYPVSDYERKDKRSKVACQVFCNPRFEIREISTPNIRDDEVLIRVKACGICGSDSHVYETDGDEYVIFSGPAKLPCVLGHELAGVVEKIGSNVRTFRVGDKVAAESIICCGVCQPCRSGHPNQCHYIELMGLTIDGGFTEYVAVKERHCWNINKFSDVYSDDQLFEIGALIEPIGCAYNGMFVVGGGLRPGATVVVYGVGPIGLGAVALARIAGASKIIAFDIIDERIDIARQMGADYAYNVNRLGNPAPSQIVMELTDGEGSDVQVEAAGAAPKIIPEMEKSMASQGKIIYLGRAATHSDIFLDALVSGANHIVGARGHSGYGIYPNIIRLIASGKLDVSRIITSRHPFSQITDGIKQSVKRVDGKIMIKMQ